MTRSDTRPLNVAKYSAERSKTTVSPCLMDQLVSSGYSSVLTSTRTGNFPTLAVGGDWVVGARVGGDPPVGGDGVVGVRVGGLPVGGDGVGKRDGGEPVGGGGFGPTPQRAGGVEEWSHTILSIPVLAEETRE